MAEPSWCMAVIIMWRMPAVLAMGTHSAALNSTGLNREATVSYSATGIYRGA